MGPGQLAPFPRGSLRRDVGFERQPGLSPVLLPLDVLVDIRVAELDKAPRRDVRVGARRVGAVDDHEVVLVRQYVRCELVDAVVRQVAGTWKVGVGVVGRAECLDDGEIGAVIDPSGELLTGDALLRSSASRS